MLASGELDLMGCMLFSEERTEDYEYSTLVAGQVFTSLFVRSDSALTNNDFSALNGITVAANTATLNDDDLLSFGADSGFTVGGFLPCGDMQEVIDAVLDGAADGGVIASYQPVENTRIIASFAPRPFYFATAKGNAAVSSALNRAMNAILVQDPYYSQKLSEKYSQTYVGQIALSEQEQKFVAQIQPIQVCYSDAWFPLIQAGDDARNPIGVVPDLLAKISDNTGLQFQHMHVSTHAQALEQAATGGCDLLSVCVYDLAHARAYDMTMTDPYFQMQLVMASKTTITDHTMTIGTVADLPLYNTATAEDDAITYQYYTTGEKCFEALRLGETDAIVVNAYTANYYLALSKYSRFLRTNLQKQCIPICIAVSNAYSNQALLLSVLNKAIANLSTADINRIILENTVRDSSGLEAAVNRIPTTVVVLAFLFLFGLTILIAVLSAALVRKSKLARKYAEAQKAEAEYAAQQLRMDALTGVYNESGFDGAARQRLNDFPQLCWFLLDFDVDGFKYVNALYGKAKADQLLTGLVHIIKENLRTEEICGRIYGDHFVCLLSGATLSEIKTRVLQVNERFRAMTNNYLIIMSYGIYQISDFALSISAMCDRAQVAKRKIKGNYKECIAIYDEILDKRQKEDVEMIVSVDHALANGEFETYFQPQYDIKTEKIVSAEALVRWRRNDVLIMPDRFINLFESNGLIEKLDFYMVQSVCAHLKVQLAAGLSLLPISINFSKSHLYDQAFLPKLRQIIVKSGVPAELLVAEFTEYTCLENANTFCEIIRQLHQIGMRVSLDDFGSGYSSLNMLHHMNFDEIKLDKDFLKESPLSAKTQTMICAILQLLQSLKIQTVAEGVETAEQVALLRENGCDLAQGYYFCRPIPAGEYDDLLRNTQ